MEDCFLKQNKYYFEKCLLILNYKKIRMNIIFFMEKRNYDINYFLLGNFLLGGIPLRDMK